MNSLSIGTVLHGGANTYTIEKELGQGSFGITYLANTKAKVQGPLGMLETEMKVAIKEFFMKDLNGRNGTMVTSVSTAGKEGLYEKYKGKFINESKNLSKLSHPNIVKVLESFEANNTAYYAMEYCSGGSLDERIKQQGSLSESKTKDIASKIGSALSYMHKQGILHLDLKPGNIVLRADGTPVLIDFGLAKQYTTTGEPENSTTVGLGTPGYAPIEQADYKESKGKFPVTMDVYALGATVFKMLTGNTPPKASEIMNEGFPAYELQEKNISTPTMKAIAKAMASRVADRCQTVADFMALLQPNNIVAEKTIIATKAEYNNEETQLTAEIDTSYQPNNTIAGHEYVDLGLSVKWATCNVGANKPEECGDYFAWGETETKKEYTNNNCKTMEYKFLGFKIIDKKENFKDTARANWGGTWRLPTKREIEELKNKCTWKWIRQNGVRGMKVTGPNGNSIFLPAAGIGIGSSLNRVDDFGNYWSSTTDEKNYGYYGAYSLYFYSHNHGEGWYARGNGRTVRPVSE